MAWVAAVPTVAAAQSVDPRHAEARPEVRAVPVSGRITLDGRLDEAVWRNAPAATDFRQSEPEEGAPATQRTEVRFAFDDAALYVGARMYDDAGAAGVRRRLVRRDDDTDGDELTLVFDTYHDHLGRTEFRIQPSGSRGDALGPGGAPPDPSWDPVWEAATHVDSLGWTAELRIPLSQLHFSRATEQTWGLQIVRMVSRLNERSHWAFWRLNEAGGPSRYGHLVGLRIEDRPRGLEILPYAVGRSAFVEPAAAGDPFHDARAFEARVGADLRYRLTSNLTLSATINPDFGQVEVDPAVVNLSAFETFFPEKRPFFVEGAGMFSFGGLTCFFCSNISSLNVFYSRREGRAPQGAELARSAGEYADVPDNTTILGAAKVTGRTAGGWTVAMMDAVTRRERARVATADGTRFTREVAPLSNYFVGRVKRDLRGGDLVVGGVLSTVYRDFEDPALAGLLSRHAEVGGVDADLWWGDRTYHLMADLAVSRVAGEPAAIRAIQESSAHYFQRPDRDGGDGPFSDAYDPSATSLLGYGAFARLAKDAGDWRWEVATSIRSPGFETNDVAFLDKADYVWMSGNVWRPLTRPTRLYRRLDLMAGAQQRYNYDGDLIGRQFHAYAGGQLPNYWDASIFYIRRSDALDDRLTRGGPAVGTPGGSFMQVSLATDRRRRMILATYPAYYWYDDGARYWSLGLELTYRPSSNVSLTIGPEVTHDESGQQYVDAWDDPTATAFHGRRYLFADLVQRTVSMNTRLNVTFTPTLSFELFAQPLISGARFTGFKEFVSPRSPAMRAFGKDFGTLTVDGTGEDRTYTVDADGAAGPAPAYTFDDPDFNFRSLRGNAVLRWEWRPGSTLYLVWTQDRSDTAPYGDVRLGRDGDALLRARPDDIFLVKVSYWLGV
ncbi:MAG TPA: DUF5916 domain-containing protein [Longimicrobiales bacterium]